MRSLLKPVVWGVLVAMVLSSAGWTFAEEEKPQAEERQEDEQSDEPVGYQERVVVTGTRIPRDPNLTGPLPVDVLECPECGGRLRILAAIHPPEVARLPGIQASGKLK